MASSQGTSILPRRMLEQQIVQIMCQPDRGDSIVDARIRALLSRLRQFDLSPGGWLQRFSVLTPILIDGQVTLRIPTGGTAVLLTRVKLAARILAENDLWNRPEDVESLFPHPDPLPNRLLNQSLFLIQSMTAIVSSGESAWIDLVGERFGSIMQTLEMLRLRQGFPALEKALQGLLKRACCEYAARHLPGQISDDLLLQWIGPGQSEQKKVVLRALQDTIALSTDERLEEWVEALIGGPESLRGWARRQGSSHSVPDRLEPVVARTVLALLEQADAQGSWIHQGQPLMTAPWIERLRDSLDESETNLLHSLVAKRAPWLWSACLFPEEREDLETVQEMTRLLFPAHRERLGDRFDLLIQAWMEGGMPLPNGWERNEQVSDEDLLDALEVLGWLGVRPEHARSIETVAGELIIRLFPAEILQSEEPNERVRRWQLLAPLARLWSPGDIVKILGAEERFLTHLHALVQSGHPRFAGALMEALSLEPTELQVAQQKMVDYRVVVAPVEWRWWAFLLAKGPSRLQLDPERGDKPWQLTSALGNMVDAALRGGCWREEIGITLSGLLYHGADPRQTGESAAGSALEQIYVAKLSAGRKSAEAGFRHLLSQLEELFNRIPLCDPMDRYGAISCPLRPPSRARSGPAHRPETR